MDDSEDGFYTVDDFQKCFCLPTNLIHLSFYSLVLSPFNSAHAVNSITLFPRVHIPLTHIPDITLLYLPLHCTSIQYKLKFKKKIPILGENFLKNENFKNTTKMYQKALH